MNLNHSIQSKEIPVFICYRQADGREAAFWLYKHLNGRRLPNVVYETAEQESTLSVYLDTAAPAVSDWHDLHLPSLQRSRAMLLVCTPGIATRLDKDDWVHMEVEWWLNHRNTAPIIIDTTGEGHRWLPKTVKARWPNTQRVDVCLDEWESLPEDEIVLRRDIVLERITSGIVASESGIHFDELEKEKRRTRKTKVALWAMSVALVLAVIATGISIRFERLAASRQQIADANAVAAKRSAENARKNAKIAEDSKRAALDALKLAEARERTANRNLALSLAEQAERAWANGDVFAAQAIALKALHHTDSSDVRARCLAIHYLIEGDKGKARTEFSSLLDTSFDDMFSVNTPLHRVQRLTRTTATRPILDTWIHLSDDDAQVYKEILRFNGLSGRIEQYERMALRRAPDLADFRQKLAKAEADLAHLTYHGSDTAKQQTWSQEFEEHSYQLAELYQTLSSRKDIAPSTKHERFSVGTQRLRAALEEDEAIIHFALSRGQYYAWIVQPNYPIVQISLGTANEVERKVKVFTDAVATSLHTVRSRGVVIAEIVRDARDTNEDLKSSGIQLGRLLWNPIASKLRGNVSQIYVAPDGILWTTPLYALPITDSEYLIDKYTLIYTLTPFDVVNPPQWTTPGKGILLIGDVDYEEQRLRKTEPAAVVRKASHRNDFLPLPGTLTEVRAIRDIINSASNDRTRLLTGRNAREETVRESSHGFRVIHFATHGWATHKLRVRDEYFKNSDGKTLSDIDAHLLSLDPSLLSGVALAGANYGGIKRKDGSAQGLDDGILTAMEAASLNIEGVDLVVLSGCDTVGLARAGQSLFGLVNGYRVAGAKTIVASLFPVGDEPTARFMAEFYRTMITQRVGPANALRNAALAMKKDGASAGVWASFASYGNLNSAPFVLKDE